MITFLANRVYFRTALQTISFASAGMDATNIFIIYKEGAALQSWIPGRDLNPITGFVQGTGYQLNIKADIDAETVFGGVQTSGGLKSHTEIGTGVEVEFNLPEGIGRTPLLAISPRFTPLKIIFTGTPAENEIKSEIGTGKIILPAALPLGDGEQMQIIY